MKGRRVNVYVPDVRLLTYARILQINMSEVFVAALRVEIGRRRHEPESDAYMRTARSGSIE